MAKKIWEQNIPDDITMIRRLQKPKGRIDVVLDTDTYNEIDDQYALSYMIRSDEKLNVRALYAAPYFNDKSTSPKDGMERSYNEILTLLDLLDRKDLKPSVFRGSEDYLP
ncbi:MAG: nucleoside hydrolase, partial [Clostridia bacterium]|nr:nucleoside hydrolase [Clostridia bacterium]